MSLPKMKPFRLPQAVVSQLEECTAGFVLVYIDDQGIPDIIMNADNEMTKLGLVKYCAHTFSSIDDLHTAELRGELIIEERDCDDFGSDLND